MSSWGRNVADSGVKTNNHPRTRAAKVELRRRLLEAVPHPRVLDAFAGAGRMHRDVWRRADAYVGCDRKWYPDSRLAYVADNRRLLRCIDLSAFNLFDLDAYGSPWEQAMIVAARRPVAPGEMVGMAITDGSGLKLKLGGVPTALAELAGIRGAVRGLNRLQDDLIDRLVDGLGRRMRCCVRNRWQAEGKTGAQVQYLALVLQGLGQ